MQARGAGGGKACSLPTLLCPPARPPARRPPRRTLCRRPTSNVAWKKATSSGCENSRSPISFWPYL